MLTDQQQYRIDKEKQIAAVAANLAQTVARLTPIAYPRKRPRICAPERPRAHGSARTRARMAAFIQIKLATCIAMAQVYSIISQPTPKYPLGGIINDGK